VKVLRAAAGADETGTVRALDLKGLPLGEAPFASSRRTARPRRVRPAGRNPQRHRAHRDPANAPPAPCNCSTSAGAAAPSASFPAPPPIPRSRCCRRATTSRALGPFADVRLAQGESPAEAVDAFSRSESADADPCRCRQCRRRRHDRLAHWIEDGGVLVRFAGPRLAASDDDLVPVKLRRGGRILGGSLSWDKPQPLAAFSRESPFNGMPVPNDVTVNRQVLAEPDAR
jgi:hypothetical protein